MGNALVAMVDRNTIAIVDASPARGFAMCRRAAWIALATVQKRLRTEAFGLEKYIAWGAEVRS